MQKPWYRVAAVARPLAVSSVPRVRERGGVAFELRRFSRFPAPHHGLVAAPAGNATIGNHRPSLCLVKSVFPVPAIHNPAHITGHRSTTATPAQLRRHAAADRRAACADEYANGRPLSSAAQAHRGRPLKLNGLKHPRVRNLCLTGNHGGCAHGRHERRALPPMWTR
jgi:hypothetical protein